MDSTEFRVRGKEMIDFLADYMENVDKKRVSPTVRPGYLKELIPLEAPERPESWNDIMKDIQEKIMIGMTHWQHPNFHAYYPSGNSYPSILADILGDVIGCIGFSWIAGPACTELETIVVDWFGKMLGLPEQFLASTPDGKGGGVIESSGSDAVLVAILAARALAFRKLKKEHPELDDGVLYSKLIGYCTKDAHPCLEKGAMLAFVKLKILPVDEPYGIFDTVMLRDVMDDDLKEGLYPFFCNATVGTSNCCAVDNLEEVGAVCKDFDVWLHVDAAYAGCAMICPELRHFFKGIEHATSLSVSANKWLLVNFDCTCMWVRDRFKLTQALVVDPLYLQHSFSEKSIDYRHWGVPLSRRFRALKLWFVIRSYGVEGLQAYIREHCRLAKYFANLVVSNPKFEVLNEVNFGIVCFCLKGINPNEMTQELIEEVNFTKKLYLSNAIMDKRNVVRFAICREAANEADMDFAWKLISDVAAVVMKENIKSLFHLPSE